MNVVDYDSNVMGTTYTVGQLIGTNLNPRNKSAFMGKVGEFVGLFLVCKLGIFPAARPDVVFYDTSRVCLVDYFVDVKIKLVV